MKSSPPPPSGARLNRLPRLLTARGSRFGFTLVELLVSMALLAVIMGIVVSALGSTLNIWRLANAKIDSFQLARANFEILTKRVSQATLNTYWDYYDATGTPFRLTTNSAAFTPSRYGRYSDLHFICGPAAITSPATPTEWFGPLPIHCTALASHALFFTQPSGVTANKNYQPLPDLLTACGFFVAFGSDESIRPSIINTPATYRWRLMELNASTESLEVFSTGTTNANAWYVNPLADAQARPIAENIIALIVWPRLPVQDDATGASIAPDYTYDSRTTAAWSGVPLKQPVQSHQLPPTLQVTMVAIDAATAKRLENGATPPAQITAALMDAGTGKPLFSESVATYDQDLEKLEAALTSQRIQYRVFTSTVALRESRWSP